VAVIPGVATIAGITTIAEEACQSITKFDGSAGSTFTGKVAPGPTRESRIPWTT
jgi:hypothetical protein